MPQRWKLEAPPHQLPHAALPTPPSSTFVANLRTAAFADCSDVTLTVGEADAPTTEIAFSRFLLAAQSPVFSSMLYGTMAESRAGAAVRVEFAEPVVRQMLDFACTDHAELACETVVDLLRCAEYYQIAELTARSEAFVSSQLGDETATTFLAAAQRRGLRAMEERCLGYVLEHASTALTNGGLLGLSMECMLQLIQSDSLRIRELDLFTAVVRWGEANASPAAAVAEGGGGEEGGEASREAVKQFIAPLMQHVRFPLMSGEVLANRIEPLGLVAQDLLYEAVMAQFKKQASASASAAAEEGKRPSTSSPLASSSSPLASPARGAGGGEAKRPSSTSASASLPSARDIVTADGRVLLPGEQRFDSERGAPAGSAQPGAAGGGGVETTAAAAAASPPSERFRRRRSPYIELTRDRYSIPEEDRDGLFHYLGTAGGTTKYTNPAVSTEFWKHDVPKKRLVSASWSSEGVGQAEDWVGLLHEPTECFTGSVSDSWMEVDLGESRRMLPACYALRHGCADPGNFLSSWELCGRCLEAEEWSVISAHVNDTKLHGRHRDEISLIATLSAEEAAEAVAHQVTVTDVDEYGPLEPGDLHLVEADLEEAVNIARRSADRGAVNWAQAAVCWDVEADGEQCPQADAAAMAAAEGNEGYRFFRLRMTGRDSSGYQHLMCCGFELWGRLTDENPTQ